MEHTEVDATTWLTVREAARVAGVDDDTVRRWADSHRIRHRRTPGGHRRIDQASLLAALEPPSRRTAAAFRDPLDAVAALEVEADSWIGWQIPRRALDDDLARTAMLIGSPGQPGSLINALETVRDGLLEELRRRDNAATDTDHG